MKRLFISQPMNGRSNRAIMEERQGIIDNYMANGWDVIDSVLNMGPADAIKYLAASIELMSDADRVLMMRGWEKARGCKIEHEVAVLYGKDIVYENGSAD